MDFGALPPEVNSLSIYSGPGSAPMLAAATAWDTLAAELEDVARGYCAVTTELTGENWSGSSALAMASAASLYVQWSITTAALAEQTAGQARAAAGAYEAAFAATVPPAEVAANRIQFATLVATNIFGQNATMIAATEIAYAEMWAQDATAMYGYAGSSASASTLTAFTPPPTTTNAAATQVTAAGSAGAARAHQSLAQLVSAVPQRLLALSSGGQPKPPSWWSLLLTTFTDFNAFMGPVGLVANFSRTTTSAGSFLTGVARTINQPVDAAKEGADGTGATTLASDSQGGSGGPVLASVGRAAPIGKLSVPSSWAAPAPLARAVSEPLWLSERELETVPSMGSSPETGMLGAAAGAGIGPMAGLVTRPGVNGVLRTQPRRFSMPRPPAGG